MEQLRKEALAYYNNSSTEVKAKAIKFFNLMDADGNSSINLAELASFIKGFKVLSRKISPEEVFISIDKNGNGSLDFSEFITFFFWIFSTCTCDCCGAKLLGRRHVTCASCFYAGAADTFDLCSTCFASKRFAHQHTCFLDFEALMMATAAEYQQKQAEIKLSKKPSLMTKLTTPESLEKLDYVNRLTKTSLEVVQQMTSSGGCNIM